MKNQDLTSKALSPPRLVILLNETKTINNVYAVCDGTQYQIGKDMKEALQFLLIMYYVYDFSYPKCYQLLGFLQVALFRDDAPFFKCAKLIKFLKEFKEKTDRENDNNDDI